jgi:hypothetical protein
VTATVGLTGTHAAAQGPADEPLAVVFVALWIWAQIKQGTPFMMGPMNSSYAVATNSSGQPTSGYLIRVLLPVYIPGCTAGSLYGQPQVR